MFETYTHMQNANNQIIDQFTLNLIHLKQKPPTCFPNSSP